MARGAGPGWVVDPGPDLDAHLQRVLATPATAAGSAASR